jgi:hypothetical protein
LAYEPRLDAGAVTIERDGATVTIRIVQEARVSWVFGTLLSLIGSAIVVVIAFAVRSGLRMRDGVMIVMGLCWAACLILGAVLAFRPRRPKPMVMTATPRGFVYEDRFCLAAYEIDEIGGFFVRPAQPPPDASNTHELCLRLVDGQEWVMGLGPPHEVGPMAKALQEGLGQ